MNIAKYIDHTILKPTATETDIAKLCREAKKYGFFAVCVNPGRVVLAKKLLKNSDVKIASVIGFPLGANSTKIKVEETKEAVKNGADEIDMVMNIGTFKEKDYQHVRQDIKAIVSAARKPVKVIIETCYLSKAEIKKACQIAKAAGAAFVKTSTGFGSGGATIEDVKLMRKIVGKKIGVKASGGVKDYEAALAMIKAGANRLGTSSGIQIVEGQPSA